MKNTKISAAEILCAGKSRRALVRALAALLCIAVLLPLLGACRRPSDPQSASVPTEAPASPSPSPAPVSGGTLRMAMPENLRVGNPQYSPLIVSTEEELYLYSLVFEPLIAIDEAGALVPSLATKWTRSETDGHIWTLTLRDGVSWHSGDKLTADDVVDCFRTLVVLGSASYYSRTLEYITSIDKVNASTLRVTARSTGMLSLYALNFPIFRPNGAALSGTGAYRVASHSDTRILLTANDSWWDRTPYITNVEFLARDSNDTALASYGAGQLDLVPTALLAAGKYAEAGETVVRDYMTQSMETLLFNHRRSLPMHPVFRKAIALGINRGRIITNIYMNRARSADVPVPPDSWLYNANNAQITYDRAASERLFEELGCVKNSEGLLVYNGKPIELTLLVSGTKENTTRSDAAAAIASQLGSIGLTVNVTVAAHGYGDDDSEFMTALRSMDWDIALIGFSLAQINDLSPYLASDGKNNFGGYSGAAFPERLEGIAAAPDEETLREQFHALQAEFIENLPFLVLYFRLNSAVYTAQLEGLASLREPALLRGIKNWYFTE